MIRSIWRSCFCCYTASVAVKCSGCAGDVDEEDGELRIRQHIQRVHGELRIGPVKTAAGRRDLPLLDPAAEVLAIRRAVQAADRAELGRAWQDTGLIFTTKTGGPSSHAILLGHSIAFVTITDCGPSACIICDTRPRPC